MLKVRNTNTRLDQMKLCSVGPSSRSEEAFVAVDQRKISLDKTSTH
jgi:hypothetical protein